VALARLWAGRGDVAIYHVVGRRDAGTVAVPAPTGGDGAGELIYRQVAYENAMVSFYRAADVVVSRAGASTVAELTVLGVPSILVPLPGAPDDHQTMNAGRVAGVGGAVVVADADCSGARLAEELEALRFPADRLAEMGKAAGSVGRPDAVAAVVAVVESHARAGPRPTGSPDAGTRARHGTS
jgi:UDP-N-acetylglucosamine--N-acetylmuramyl-(pentapeptide) pyrophosphoryl-undecaprenol N-acetylglucosamine transferase